MNPIKLFTAILLAVVSTCCVAFVGSNYVLQQPVHVTDPNGFAVIELFTSEGCSSCPPADELAGKIQQEYKNEPVYILVYHVDYWDRMGWKDTYSNAAYTQCQSEYSQSLGAQIYTPQAVVNGQAEFVGSDESKLRKTLTEAITGKPAAGVKINAEEVNGNLLINYSVTGKYKPAVIRVALIQKTATRQIKRGENQGHTLTHWQIVRGLKTVAIGNTGTGKIQMPVPPDFSKKDWEIIAMLQNSGTGKMYAATKTAFTVIATEPR
ncbi:hypothetical protein Q765_17385 [Flavobacterium rivuli WB 3.3-2 = DSM 21788]|uniref:DUF1223 domain-containing protein n=1 Tax=Flavobacterium rivuli WB 3.3-2 = DSM 21788 TaxID=1121895 RepID=A0A0A2MAG1_9FLAO|nr:DUF1223 domain-containing protein [Flavobacterium rivuli]KGO85265.1 hypothetical protein Q765_17385 [Flavobacterium rivuli WB 3.3-2 = DSM 21788]